MLLTLIIVVMLAGPLPKKMACFVRDESISSRPCKVCETSGYLRLQRWIVGCLNSLEMVCGNEAQRQIINMNTDYGLGDASGNIGTTQRFVDSRPLSSVGQSIAEVEARCQRADTVARATNSALTAHQDITSAYSELLSRGEPSQLDDAAVLSERQSVFEEGQHERSEQETAVFLEDADQSVPEGDAGTADRGASGEVDEGGNQVGAAFDGPGPLATREGTDAMQFQAGDQDVEGPTGPHNTKMKAGPTMDSISSVAAAARQVSSSLPMSLSKRYPSNPSSPTPSQGSLEERLNFPSFSDLFGQHQVRFDRALDFLGRRAPFVASAIKILMTEDNSMSPSASWAACLRSARSVFDAYELSAAELYQIAVERGDPGIYARYQALQLEYPIEDWE